MLLQLGLLLLRLLLLRLLLLLLQLELLLLSLLLLLLLNLLLALFLLLFLLLFLFLLFLLFLSFFWLLRLASCSGGWGAAWRPAPCMPEIASIEPNRVVMTNGASCMVIVRVLVVTNDNCINN